MIDDNLRASVARELREMAYRERFDGRIIARIIDAPCSGTVRYDHDAWYRLADMIEPNPDICAECPERKLGADEERQAQAIARHVVREVDAIACDRKALLELADEMGRVRSKCDFCIKNGGCDWADETICLESRIDDYAQRIREALGASE